MFSIVVGVFCILHGLVHLLYAGQARRFFALKPGMVWPDGSWVFSKILGDANTRSAAFFMLGLAAIGFVVCGLGLLFRAEWWRVLAVVSCVLSTLVFLLLWDGKLRGLDEQGGVGILINSAILALVYLLKW